MAKKSKIKLISWNVSGIRAAMKKGFLDWFKSENPHILCLQETKAERSQVLADKQAKELFTLTEYESYWHSAEKKGYSGVVTFTKIKPVSNHTGFLKDHKLNFNNEGRIVATEFDSFILWNVYFPNGGRGPERVSYKLEFYEYCLMIWEELRKKKPLIICGDFNTAHKEIDLARPAENVNNSGFMPVERAFLDKMVAARYVDVFRHFDPSPGKYTYWDQITRARSRNVGWRIDYFFVSAETMPFITDTKILMDVMGSDHCPITLELSL